MIITDQPGRYITIFILCPLLVIFAYLIYKNKIKNTVISIIIIIFTIIFFSYELFWILNYPSKKIIFK